MHITRIVSISLQAALSVVLAACAAPAPGAAGAGTSTIDNEDSLSGTIAVSGAFALYPMMTVWAEEFSKLHPDVQFDVQGGGAGKGMTDTLARAVDIGMISREIKPEEEAQGAFWVSVAKDAVFPIVNAGNPFLAELITKGVSREGFRGIYITGEINTWGKLLGRPEIIEEIHVYTRSDSCGAGEQWALFTGSKVQTDLQGIGINGEPALVDTVSKDPLGIGYSNLNSTFDPVSSNLVEGIAVPPLDIDGNGKADPTEYYQSKERAVEAIANGTYPSPPARLENLATKGRPSGLVLAFIGWILTDGQELLDQAGYVRLSPDQQAEALAKLRP